LKIDPVASDHQPLPEPAFHFRKTDPDKNKDRAASAFAKDFRAIQP
jgi:hypothetical protein